MVERYSLCLNIEELKKIECNRILLQFPEGIKAKIIRICEEIKKITNAEVILSGDVCYGACDIRINEAKLMNCDLIIHIGHSDFGVHSDIPVIYIPIKFKVKLSKKLREDLSKIEDKNIGIFTSEPYNNLLKDLEELYKDRRIVEKKIIFGCYDDKYYNKRDAAIFIGSGKFHPLCLRGKVYFCDIERNRLVVLDTKKEEMKKYARIQKLKEAERVGILISSKLGQYYGDFVELKSKLEKSGKYAEIIIMDEITDDKLIGMNFDMFINTACPRILDNKFTKPIINLRDIDLW
ncbi:MAG: diphthamide biosynthesis enzyme Dph2 [Candidatus Aenigmarchaeota archaeon ex4484_56]|nr:MAG: diphthamide biosynthesis enzyme Dph2 [Candidatus Aenigmarchaeota archaeon ex4484_56]